jgi:hypothetical protein
MRKVIKPLFIYTDLWVFPINYCYSNTATQYLHVLELVPLICLVNDSLCSENIILFDWWIFLVYCYSTWSCCIKIGWWTVKTIILFTL